MDELPSLTIPAGDSISFGPGDVHLMLIEVTPVEVGGTIDVTLEFGEDTRTVTASVIDPTDARKRPSVLSLDQPGSS